MWQVELNRQQALGLMRDHETLDTSAWSDAQYQRWCCTGLNQKQVQLE